MNKKATALPRVVSRKEWLAEREALLIKEKAATRARDALNAERRRLPMVRIEKDYLFDGPDGKVTLLDLFEGRRQLILSPEGWPQSAPFEWWKHHDRYGEPHKDSCCH